MRDPPSQSIFAHSKARGGLTRNWPLLAILPIFSTPSTVKSRQGEGKIAPGLRDCRSPCPVTALKHSIPGKNVQKPFVMKREYAAKHCVVTGAGSGIGRAVALDLAGRGAMLALSDINDDGLAETREMIGAADNRHRYDRLDVADRAAIERYAEDLGGGWGAADYLFNIAGLSRVGAFADTQADAFDKVLDVNFYGTVSMCRAFLPRLLETRGAITNISSVFGLIGFPGQAHYCASKFAVRGFSETLAMELAPKGVSVTCVHPGGVSTNIARAAVVDSLPDGFQSREKLDKKFDKAARTSPASAARTIIEGTAKGKRRVIVGADGHVISTMQRLFPRSYQWVVANILR